MLTDILGWLAGKKSYLLGFGMIVIAGAYSQGYITEIAFKALMALLGGGTAMALRAAISKGANHR